MKIKFNAAWLPVFVFSLIILLVLDLKSISAGTYPGKWYGWYCPEVKEADLAGLYKGDAFPDQVVTGSWGYKADDVDEKGHLQNYKAGIPFPGSKKGIELAWNLVNARNFGEKMWCRFASAVINKRGHTRYAVNFLLESSEFLMLQIKSPQ